MDKKTLDFVLGAIESLKTGQKVIAKQVITLTDAVKNSIDKLKREKIDDNAALDDKLRGLESRCENLQMNIDNHDDVINELEKEKLKVENMIKKIDDNLEDVHKKMHESLTKIENISDETQKQCIFDRKGFCREGERCKFFHSQEICSEFIEHRVCTKTICRKRHPKDCRYFNKSICLRGESCKYLHDQRRGENKCSKCEKFTLQKYFCEFCTKSFCPECTVKEAHNINIYEERDEIGCSNIHDVSEINEHFEEMVWSTEDCVERASAGCRV